MGSQWARDKVYTRAMKAGYRSRAAYKLLEIQERNEIIRPDDNVVDLGAAPGSWLQVLREMTDGKIVGVDLNPIAPMEGVTTIVGDFTEEAVRERIRTELEVVNVVVSDASPKLSGHKSYDQARAIGLGEEALAFACGVLKPGGNFVIKSFQGELFADLMNEIKEQCRDVYYCKKFRRMRGWHYRTHTAGQ
jgi:23S rRNA (uridine2552-2'-O)-methyltransferase